MTDSMARKAALLAAAVAGPLALLCWFAASDWRLRLLTALLFAAAIAVAGFAASIAARRVEAFTRFVNGLLEQRDREAPPAGSDDELGELGRSLGRIAPRIRELINRLTNDLTRREQVLASLAEGVLAVDAQLNVTFCNRSFRQAVGEPAMQEGVPLIRVVRDPALFRVLKQVVDSGVAVRERLQLFGSEGRTFEVNAAPLANSTIRGAIAILHDVTPAERLERVKRDFIANVSHEFRTPLATIRGYAETLLDGGLEDVANRRKFVEIIQANGVRLNNIASDLLTLSELEAGRPEPGPGPISVSDAVQGAMHAVEPAARLRGLKLERGPIPPVQILGYGIRFEQALLNLLDNAVKFNREDGEVRVEVLENAEHQVEISVADTGVGIPPLDLSRVFERFYRVDKARSRQVGGTGLGLSIVKHAIEQMNGAIAVESELGRGSKFKITLPQYENR